MNPFQAMGQVQNLMQNPMGAMMEQMKARNPQLFSQVQQMTSGKSDAQLKEIAENMARERGIDLKSFASGFGIKI
jgi:hypothetical protein